MVQVVKDEMASKSSTLFTSQQTDASLFGSFLSLPIFNPLSSRVPGLAHHSLFPPCLCLHFLPSPWLRALEYPEPYLEQEWSLRLHPRWPWPWPMPIFLLRTHYWHKWANSSSTYVNNIDNCSKMMNSLLICRLRTDRPRQKRTRLKTVLKRPTTSNHWISDWIPKSPILRLKWNASNPITMIIPISWTITTIASTTATKMTKKVGAVAAVKVVLEAIILVNSPLRQRRFQMENHWISIITCFRRLVKLCLCLPFRRPSLILEAITWD